MTSRPEQPPKTAPVKRGRGRPRLPASEVRYSETVRLKIGARKMLNQVAAATGEKHRSRVIRRYIAEGLSRDADKLT